MINKVILVGRVGADPEIVTFESGNKTAKLRIATTERTYNKETKEAKEYTEWHSVVFFYNLADVVDKWVKKGSQLYIEGSLRTREYTDKAGTKRHTTEIIGKELKLLGAKPSEGANNGAGKTYQHEAPIGTMEPTPPMLTDEDIPF